MKKVLIILLFIPLFCHAQWNIGRECYRYDCHSCPIELKTVVIDSSIQMYYSDVRIIRIDVVFYDSTSMMIGVATYRPRNMNDMQMRYLKNFIKNEYGWFKMTIYYSDRTSIDFLLPTKKSYRY